MGKHNKGGRRRRRGRRGKRRNNNNNRKKRNGRKSARSDKFGGREPTEEVTRPDGPLDLNAFNLFCSYWLGITPDNRYKKPNPNRTAQHFHKSPDDIESALRNCGMDKHTLRSVDYDFSLAQLDVKVAPDGIDKMELARPLFEEFMEVNPHFVDWSEGDDTEEDTAE